MGNIPTRNNKNKNEIYLSSSSRSDSSELNGYENPIFRESNDFHGIRNNLFLDNKAIKKRTKEKKCEKHYLDLVIRLNENVDGGYLAPQGIYKSNLDFNTEIVRGLIIKRKIAPFYISLETHNKNWTDTEIFNKIINLSLHKNDNASSENEYEDDDIDLHKIQKMDYYYKKQEQKVKIRSLITRMRELQKIENEKYNFEKKKFLDLIKNNDTKNETSFSTKDSCFNVPNNIITLDSKNQKKKLDNLFSKDIPSFDLIVFLYSNVIECPICFLYYPENINYTKCCYQPICTECFVQIKRQNPNLFYHEHLNQSDSEFLSQFLISESVKCPYCALSEFAVFYNPPDISTGINGKVDPAHYVKSNTNKCMNDTSDQGENSLLKSSLILQKKIKNQNQKNDQQNFVTLDMIRPNWEQILMVARNKLAKKSAAATAIHTSNMLMNIKKKN